jgi:hypothetical protein
MPHGMAFAGGAPRGRLCICFIRTESPLPKIKIVSCPVVAQTEWNQFVNPIPVQRQ